MKRLVMILPLFLAGACGEEDDSMLDGMEETGDSSDSQADAGEEDATEDSGSQGTSGDGDGDVTSDGTTGDTTDGTTGDTTDGSTDSGGDGDGDEYECEGDELGQLTICNCEESWGADVSEFFKKYFKCSEITKTANGHAIWTDDLPPHPSPYYAQNDPNWVQFDTQGGTHNQNPNQVGAGNYTINFPDNPTPKGITINAGMVDNLANTSNEEYGLGPQGVSSDSVIIFNAMAAPGDTLQNEYYTFDLYNGHPAMITYHYHMWSAGPVEVMAYNGISSTETPGEAEAVVYGVMNDGTIILGCNELDGSSSNTSDYDAQNGHVHDIEDEEMVHFTDRYHVHVCANSGGYEFFPEIAYYE
jgi:hypothetical protein